MKRPRPTDLRRLLCGPHVPRGDFRTDDQRSADAVLVGAWWRCSAHGLTQRAILLGPVAYCPGEDCTSRVILVHRINDDYRPRFRP